MTPVASSLIEHAITILGIEDIESDVIESKVAMLVDNTTTARRLIDWPPEAFGIVLATHLAKIEISKTFMARDLNGRWQTFPLTDEPIFVESLQIAQQMSHDGRWDTFKNVAMRSSIMDAISAALRDRQSLDGRVFSGPTMLGIPAEIYTRPSTSFWRRFFPRQPA